MKVGNLGVREIGRARIPKNHIRKMWRRQPIFNIVVTKSSVIVKPLKLILYFMNSDVVDRHLPTIFEILVKIQIG